MDASTWAAIGECVGGAGTWVIGIAGGIIAAQQLRNSSFRPSAVAQWETGSRDRRRHRRMIVVYLTNEGGAPGTVERIDIVGVDHDDPDDVRFYGWPAGPPPLPFELPGKSKATVALVRKDGEPFRGDRRPLVTYGDGKRPTCVHVDDFPFSLIETRTRIPGRSDALAGQSRKDRVVRRRRGSK